MRILSCSIMLAFGTSVVRMALDAVALMSVTCCMTIDDARVLLGACVLEPPLTEDQLSFPL
jgi:hypothetical protein